MAVHGADESAFDDTVRRYNEAFESRDVDRFITFFRDDATKIDPDGTFAQGSKEIAELFGGLFQMEFTAEFPAIRKVIDGSTALLVTEITLTFPEFEEHFYTALTFTHDADGEWRVLAAASTKLADTRVGV
jgi:uncharacterized protein (TIGR02246 family)